MPASPSGAIDRYAVLVDAASQLPAVLRLLGRGPIRVLLRSELARRVQVRRLVLQRVGGTWRVIQDIRLVIS